MPNSEEPPNENSLKDQDTSLQGPCIAYLELTDTPSSTLSKELGFICVTDERMIQKLWKLGSFGVGSLSRTLPTWSARSCMPLPLALNLTDVKRPRVTYVEHVSQLRKLSRLSTLERSQQAEFLMVRWNELYNEGALVRNLESLHLLPEEALYLKFHSYLEIFLKNIAKDTDSKQHSLLPLDIFFQYWCKYPNFVTRAIAYRFFRDQGWIPKSGAPFGVDLVLYQKSPQFVHSKYAIVLCRIKPESLLQDQWPLPNFKAGPVAWLKTIERVASHAKKKLVLCYVVVSDDDLNNPEVVFQQHAQEKCHCIQLQRWIPERHR